ncbi:unnamed protein product [Angiostrongylus costaricensis]|uniref:NADH-ubiquinone oxidoreductase chain 3 n=1 Tax=Angiostrongylus costaricensis TaxID=334426 RepID=A0A0R3PY12_ANGCS|nr:unnamed protein product [Angiostrongylus costaricensis]
MYLFLSTISIRVSPFNFLEKLLDGCTIICCSLLFYYFHLCPFLLFVFVEALSNIGSLLSSILGMEIVMFLGLLVTDWVFLLIFVIGGFYIEWFYGKLMWVV